MIQFHATTICAVRRGPDDIAIGGDGQVTMGESTIMKNGARKVRQIYKNKCQLMLDEMKKYFHPDVQYTIPTGGMFIWVTLPEHIDMQNFVQAALKQNVAVVPGNAFLDDDTKECHSFRMNFSTPTDEKIKQGVKILGDLTYSMNK